MIDQTTLLCPVALLRLVSLHGSFSAPVPHWLALIVAGPGLWVIIGAVVMIGDRFLERI